MRTGLKSIRGRSNYRGLKAAVIGGIKSGL